MSAYTIERDERYRRMRAARQKKSRLRRKLGVVVVGVEVDATVVDFLVQRKWLPDEVTDLNQIGEAVTRMISEITHAAAR